VLLTAYADTGAAIDAITSSSRHYLLKPWDPPEEKLYPVVDALLDTWSPAAGPRGRLANSRSADHRWSTAIV